MKKIWELLQNILIIPWLVLEWIWDILPKPVGLSKWFKEEALGWFIFLSVTAASIAGALFTEFWWALALWFFITLYIGVTEKGNRSFDDNFGMSFLASVIAISSISGLIYGYEAVMGFDEIKTEETIYVAKNIKYIADPNDKYILMDKETMEQNYMPMKEFYEFRERGCKVVRKTHTRVDSKNFHSKFGHIENVTYSCEMQ